jgi:hypothetical protein
VQEEIPLVQPAKGKVIVKVAEEKVKYYGSDWFGFSDDWDWPFFSLNEDSLMLNTVRVELVKSQDSSFHTYAVKIGRGYNPSSAQLVATKINFKASQHDSILLLPKGFAISQQEKFRNQQVLVIVEIPIGKKIEVDKSVNFYRWFNINMNHRRGWNISWNDDWDDSYNWDDNTEYIMTSDGLERTHKIKNDDDGDDDKKDKTEKSEGYRYKKNSDSITSKKNKDSIKSKTRSTKTEETPNNTTEKEAKAIGNNDESEHAFSPVYSLAELI